MIRVCPRLDLQWPAERNRVLDADDFENVRAVDAREFQAALDRTAERVRREGAGDGRR